ncbi:MAG TPA: GlsB/YeaQ/YmgE family stress response membrane protein [Candidatus Sulfotelmatobacter sp.]|nr:GlsB/YeaQ/YmgE family stress response membrane protein [Candidatus Sulfotelmatobacter sp.]
MTLGMFLLWTIMGLAAGLAAGYVMKEGGYGLIGDTLLGVIGSVVGSGLYLYVGNANPGVVMSLVVAFIGAAALIFAQHTFWAVPA